MAKLTARFVAAVKDVGSYGDGDHLYLRVAPGGSKSWLFRWSRGGRTREMGLGSSSLISLADARRKAEEARRLLGQGIDPLEAKKAVKTAINSEAHIPTFGKVADDLISDLSPSWRNQKHRAQWAMTLGDAYCKSLRKKKINEIETADILAVLKTIWLTKPETASRIRGRIEAVLDAAQAHGFISANAANPARWKGHLDRLLPKQRNLIRGHHAALAFEDMPSLMMDLKARDGVAARALEFAILTAARSGEVRGAIWEEIDLTKALWIIPAKRMKAQREHRVPLSNRALAILTEVQLLMSASKGSLIFPGYRDRPLSDMSLSAVLRRMKRPEITVHGFRSSFRDWCGEKTQYPREIAEAALAHLSGDETERAYRRGDALEKRRDMMETWAEFCDEPLQNNLIKLNAR